MSMGETAQYFVVRKKAVPEVLLKVVDIFQFHDNSQGTTFTLTFQMDDEPGILSDVLKIIAEYQANILTIHQSIPINGIASLSLSIQVLQTTGDVSKMLEQVENKQGVHHVKILAKE